MENYHGLKWTKMDKNGYKWIKPVINLILLNSIKVFVYHILHIVLIIYIIILYIIWRLES